MERKKDDPPPKDVKEVEYAEARDRARLARYVYKKPDYPQDKGDWEEVITAEEMGYPKCSSSFGASLYKKKDEKTGKDQYAIAFRGINGVDDLDDALILAVIGYPKQFFDAYAFTRDVEEKYGIDLKKTEFIGHSMGGYLAQAVGISCNAGKIWMYNSPAMREKDIVRLPEKIESVFQNIYKPVEIDYARLDERIVSFRTQNDVVARLGKKSGTVLQSGFEIRPHSILTLEKLLDEQMEKGGQALFRLKEPLAKSGRKIMRLFIQNTKDMFERPGKKPNSPPPRRKNNRSPPKQP